MVDFPTLNPDGDCHSPTLLYLCLSPVHTSPWFSAACTTPIVPRNHVFCLYQQNKTSEYKVKFVKGSDCCKRVLEAAKLAYANMTKSLSLLRKVAPKTYSELLIVFSTKVNLLYLRGRTFYIAGPKNVSKKGHKHKKRTRKFRVLPVGPLQWTVEVLDGSI